MFAGDGPTTLPKCRRFRLWRYARFWPVIPLRAIAGGSRPAKGEHRPRAVFRAGSPPVSDFFTPAGGAIWAGTTALAIAVPARLDTPEAATPSLRPRYA